MVHWNKAWYDDDSNDGDTVDDDSDGDLLSSLHSMDWDSDYANWFLFLVSVLFRYHSLPFHVVDQAVYLLVFQRTLCISTRIMYGMFPGQTVVLCPTAEDVKSAHEPYQTEGFR